MISSAYEKLYARCQQLSAAGVAPHSLRAVTPEELTALTELAGERPLHIHIAEQTAEVDACLAWSGMRPVEFLLNHAQVAKNWCLVHATHADAHERAGIHAAGAVIGLCPVTEANLGDGIFPSHDFQGRWGIGSDSNVLISVAEELRMLEYSQRLLLRQRNVMASTAVTHTATALYQNAVAGGAQALGAFAGLVPGAAANIVTLEGDDPDLALARSVFAARAPQVRDVWVRGKKHVTGGRHRLAEQAQKRFDTVVKNLLQGAA